MGKYIAKRLLLLIPALIAVLIIVFALMRMTPGSAVDALVYKLTSAGIPADRASAEAMLGMDKPAVEQFFIWFGDLLRGDMGNSFFQSESVWNIIKTRMPVTLELGIMTLLISLCISIPCGLYCAARQDSVSDYSIRVVGVVMMSVPVFWIATLVLIYPALWWQYAPPTHYISFIESPAENLRMFLPPAILGALMQAGMELRMVRTVVLETMRQDYIRTAWAKGVGERTILFKHSLRNAMIPVVTGIGGALSMMIGGSVILENMFNIPGMGAQVVNSLDNRDYPVVQGCVLIFALFIMIVNLVVDIAYKWIDPRVELK
ncbi:MAG: ABC transporter permease [Clostridiales Family XIII bacterium]|jgi:peptide/nickel transport system permease protein|nr:ABC transporter permease [Clostridiales Family XIII bacterium]